MFYQAPAAAEKSAYEDFIRASLLSNINLAWALGAKTIINICPGCDMTWNLYGLDAGIPVLYYTEFLLGVFRQGRWEGEIDFYEGCHKLHKLASVSLARAVSGAKELLSRIEGLKYNEVSPDLCCRVVPAAIFDACRTGTLVTSSQCCYSLLLAARPQNGPSVKFLAETVCEAVRDKR
jgi:hypothetical protein